jgi:hypothetical protein
MLIDNIVQDFKTCENNFVKYFCTLAIGHWPLATGHWPLATGSCYFFHEMKKHVNHKKGHTAVANELTITSRLLICTANWLAGYAKKGDGWLYREMGG